jgi:uncharacterized protein YutE (UPF0331/DUF86 family)
MSGTDRPYEAYVYALREQVAQHLAGLDELSETLAVRPLSFNERNAAERGLQVLVEMAIGCSKHLLKARGLPVPAEARAALERVYEQLALTAPPIAVMRGAVGMRNAIIHDYLNLDWQRLETVLAGRKYHEVARYSEVLCGELLAAA